MWELDYKESWAPKNWCFWTVVLEKTLESPLDCKEIQPVRPKGDQSSIFIERTDAEAEAEAPILWPPDVKNWLIGKDPGAGKDWRWEKGMTEDEMVGWHHRLNGQEFERTQGDREGQGSMAGCSPWGCKDSNTTELLYWTELHILGNALLKTVTDISFYSYSSLTCCIFLKADFFSFSSYSSSFLFVLVLLLLFLIFTYFFERGEKE